MGAWLRGLSLISCHSMKQSPIIGWGFAHERVVTVKIYTKIGDQGYTKLGTGNSVQKHDPRVDAYGTVDELSSFLGLARTFTKEHVDLGENLLWIQQKLFEIGSILAFPGWVDENTLGQVHTADVTRLESAIDQMSQEIPELTSFIVPGGLPGAAYLHCTRSICRRTERLVSAIDLAEYPLGTYILPFLNRLSDYLFCAARLVNYRGGQSDPLAKG